MGMPISGMLHDESISKTLMQININTNESLKCTNIRA